MAARADERDKLERLCRCISRPAVSEARLSLAPGGLVRYALKTPYPGRLQLQAAWVDIVMTFGRPLRAVVSSTTGPGSRSW